MVFRDQHDSGPHAGTGPAVVNIGLV